jgi:mRNA interferase HigB
MQPRRLRSVTTTNEASHQKNLWIMLRLGNACHYTEAFERVRGKTPGYQIISRALVRYYAKKSFSEFRATARDFPGADQVEKFTVFNIGGNKVRLIDAVHYNRNKIYIRHVLTHQEYDAGNWKK